MTSHRSKITARLGVNIDHIATLREARGARYPDPAMALPILKKCKVDQVTLHVREDRRHMQDADLAFWTQAQALPVNLELAATAKMLKLALRYRPYMCTFVPEKRAEVTTEGGLDCLKNRAAVKRAVSTTKDQGILTSLFIDPDQNQIQAALSCGADTVEFHTGAYAECYEKYFLKTNTYQLKKNIPQAKIVLQKFQELLRACAFAKKIGLHVSAGHGLHLANLPMLTSISEIEEYNIGHAIIARAVFIGLENAVREIQKVLGA